MANLVSLRNWANFSYFKINTQIKIENQKNQQISFRLRLIKQITIKWICFASKADETNFLKWIRWNTILWNDSHLEKKNCETTLNYEKNTIFLLFQRRSTNLNKGKYMYYHLILRSDWMWRKRKLSKNMLLTNNPKIQLFLCGCPSGSLMRKEVNDLCLLTQVNADRVLVLITRFDSACRSQYIVLRRTWTSDLRQSALPGTGFRQAQYTKHIVRNAAITLDSMLGGS